MSEFILSIDSGTSGTKCILFDRDGNMIAQSRRSIEQIHPGGELSWTEHDPIRTWNMVQQTIDECLSIMDPTDCVAIGITNQRESVIVWDRETGAPIHNEIVWRDRRTCQICKGLSSKGNEKLVKWKTGLCIDPYFSATKIKWILDNEPGARKMAEDGRLLFGTVDCWLLWNLTGGKAHSTDMTNASRTMLYNIHKMKWDKKMLKMFGIPRSMMPEIFPSVHDFGEATLTKLKGCHIMSIIGDQQAALFGQRCFNNRDVEMTLGSGGFLLMNTSREPILSKHGLLTTVGLDQYLGNTYALEGSFFFSGAIAEWMSNMFKKDMDMEEMSRIAENVPDTKGCCVVPAFNGLGAPYWVQDAEGTVSGLKIGVEKDHIIRAAMESIAFQAYDIIRCMEKDAGKSFKRIRVDGGVSKSDFICQFLADITGTAVERFDMYEATALGVAFAAGMKCGFWERIKDLPEMSTTVFEPKMEYEDRKKNIQRWKSAVQQVIDKATRNDRVCP